MTYSIRITRHAHQRMVQRDVSEDEVLGVVNGPPSLVSHDLEVGSYRLERGLDRGRLKVWVVPPWPPTYAHDVVIVKSVAWKGR